ncbi:putative SRSF protein kinase 3-like isoform X5 [Sesbania bispinosa]|nr:putative SRSF protein kinase 3-like isoform X5 [Sesbania bispinosa]
MSPWKEVFTRSVKSLTRPHLMQQSGRWSREFLGRQGEWGHVAKGRSWGSWLRVRSQVAG